MRRVLHLLAICGTVLTVGACNGDSTGDSGIIDLTGTWNASAFTVTNISNPSETEELIGDGATLQIAFLANNMYTIAATFPGEGTDVNSGSYSQTSNSLALTDADDDEVTNFDVSVSGNTMTLTGTLDYDFGSGEVPAHLVVTLQKQ